MTCKLSAYVSAPPDPVKDETSALFFILSGGLSASLTLWSIYNLIDIWHVWYLWSLSFLERCLFLCSLKSRLWCKLHSTFTLLHSQCKYDFFTVINIAGNYDIIKVNIVFFVFFYVCVCFVMCSPSGVDVILAMRKSEVLTALTANKALDLLQGPDSLRPFEAGLANIIQGLSYWISLHHHSCGVWLLPTATNEEISNSSIKMYR